MLLARNKFREDREEGFTLIELLVVILIIGILSAIAIPAFLNQRKSAVDSTVASDVTNAAKQVETFVTKAGSTSKNFDGTASQEGTAGPSLEVTTAGVTGTSDATLQDIKVSDGTTVRITGNTFGYCIIGVNAGGDLSNTGVAYASQSGGVNKEEGTCDEGVMQPTTTVSPANEDALQASGKSSGGNVLNFDTYEATDKSYTINYSYDPNTNLVTFTIKFSESFNGYGNMGFSGTTGYGDAVWFTVVDGTATETRDMGEYFQGSTSVNHEQAMGALYLNDGTQYIV